MQMQRYGGCIGLTCPGFLQLEAARIARILSLKMLLAEAFKTAPSLAPSPGKDRWGAAVFAEEAVWNCKKSTES